MGFDTLLSATGVCQLESHMSPLPEVRELTPLGGTENLFPKFLRKADFYPRQKSFCSPA